MIIQLTWFHYHRAFGTIVRLSFSQNQIDIPQVTHTKTISNSPVTPNNDIDNTPTTKIAQMINPSLSCGHSA